MRKVWLIPAMFVLSAALIGCGGSEPEADNPDAAAANPGKDAAVDVAEIKKTPALETAKPEKSSKPAGSITAGTRVGVSSDYVLPEAVAVLVLHPQQLLKSPMLAENQQLKSQLEAMSKQYGMNPGDIEQLVMSGGPPAGPEGIQKPVSIVAKFGKAHGGKAMLEKLVAENPEMSEVVEKDHNGTAYFQAVPAEPAEEDANGFGAQASKPEDAFVFLPDEMTAVLANEEAVIQKLIDGKGTTKTKLTEKMANLDVSADAVALVVITDQLREMAANSPNPAAGSPLENLQDQLEQAVLRVSMDPEPQVQGILSVGDEQQASELDAKLKGLIQQGVAQLKMQIDQTELAAEQQPQAAMFLPAMKEVDKILAGISTKPAGADVVIDMNGLGDVNYQAIAGPVMMMMMMSGMGGGGPAGPPGGDFGPVDDFSEPAEAEPQPAEVAPDADE